MGHSPNGCRQLKHQHWVMTTNLKYTRTRGVVLYAIYTTRVSCTRSLLTQWVQKSFPWDSCGFPVGIRDRCSLTCTLSTPVPDCWPSLANARALGCYMLPRDRYSARGMCLQHIISCICFEWKKYKKKKIKIKTQK